MAKFNLASEKGLLICHAKILGKGKPVLMKMALDTGTTITIVPYEAVLSIGLNPADSDRTIEVTTGSGSVTRPIVTIPKFTCFGFTLKDLDVICHNLPSESPVEGLLCLNFLKTFKLILDFPKNTIQIVRKK